MFTPTFFLQGGEVPPWAGFSGGMALAAFMFYFYRQREKEMFTNLGEALRKNTEALNHLTASVTRMEKAFELNVCPYAQLEREALMDDEARERYKKLHTSS